MNIDLKNITLPEMEELTVKMGEKPYRGKQIAQWIYEKNIDKIDEMTNLSKEFRNLLKKTAYISSLQKERAVKSDDGSLKLLFRLKDGMFVESVLIPDMNRITLCVSTQVGCKMGCKFCLSGKRGFIRHLNHAEIVDQILTANRTLPDTKRITNIVLMGMGEPLDNYNNVVSALKTMLSPQGIKIPAKRITISTAGLVPQINNLGMENIKIRLAVSINATTDAMRTKIMPINKKYPLTTLIEACKKYPLGTGKFIMFEYVMFKGINDSLDDAKRLAHLLKGINCKINLIPFNHFKESKFISPAIEIVEQFHSYLLNKNFVTLTRKSKGRDILAACGQLSWSHEK